MYNKVFNRCMRMIMISTLSCAMSGFATSVAADTETLDTSIPTADDIIRAKIIDGLSLVDYAKYEVAQVLTVAELSVTASTWNAQADGKGATTKYVKTVYINHTSGEITITFNEANIGGIPSDSSIVFTPYIQAGGNPVPLVGAFIDQVTGAMDWGCASVTNAVSSGQNLPVITAAVVPLPSRYAPAECR